MERHTCHCGSEATNDLILYERSLSVIGKRLSHSRITKIHVYLCDEHADEMFDFLKTYDKEASRE